MTHNNNTYTDVDTMREKSAACLHIYLNVLDHHSAMQLSTDVIPTFKLLYTILFVLSLFLKIVYLLTYRLYT